MKKSILITGVAGLIGSNLAQWILDEHPEFEVIGIDNLSGGNLEYVPSNCKFYLRDQGSDLDDIFQENDIRVIYHAGAIASEALSSFRRKFYYQSNIVDSANLINYAIKYPVDRFVFFSSMAVYGNNQVPFTEDQDPKPIDPYGIGKLCVEMDLKVAAQQHGLKYTIVRPHSVYGPGQNIYDGTRNVLAIWMMQILNKQPISIYGRGSQRRAFTYIDDLMEPLWKCGILDSTLYQIFNLGNDDEIEILDAAGILEEVVGKENISKSAGIKFYPSIHEVHSAFSDHSWARMALRLECKTSLKDGLTKMWEWVQDQPRKELRVVDDFELEVNLPEQFKKK